MLKLMGKKIFTLLRFKYFVNLDPWPEDWTILTRGAISGNKQTPE